jgi:hypothetical protein
MVSLGTISISKLASAHFPTTQSVTPIPSTRMSQLSNQALERAEMALDRLRREFDRQVRQLSVPRSS